MLLIEFINYVCNVLVKFKNILAFLYFNKDFKNNQFRKEGPKS